MPSIDNASLAAATIRCGSPVTVDVDASFATTAGGYVTVQTGDGSFCFFDVGSNHLTDRVTMQVRGASVSTSISRVITCHEVGDVAVTLFVSCEDDTGASGQIPLVLLVQGC